MEIVPEKLAGYIDSARKGSFLLKWGAEVSMEKSKRKANLKKSPDRGDVTVRTFFSLLFLHKLRCPAIPCHLHLDSHYVKFLQGYTLASREFVCWQDY